MSEPSLAHKLIGFKGSVNIVLVDPDGHSHQHVLRPLDYLIVQFK